MKAPSQAKVNPARGACRPRTFGGGKAGFKQWILPRDRVLFDQLDAAAANAVAGAEELVELFRHYGGLAEHRQSLKEIEHKGDQITHTLFERLNRRTHRPFAPEELRGLAVAIDDVVDALYGVSNRLFLYEIKKPTSEMTKFAEAVLSQAREMQSALREIRDPRRLEGALKHCLEVIRIESEVDRLFNETVAALFRTADPIHILKHKEIYEILERASDRCEDVADILGTVVRKHRKPRRTALRL